MKILPNFMTLNKKEYVYDAFISHAVEDKIPIANELYELLKSKGLKVWYSGTELGVGDKVTDSIKANLEKCRFGIAIISPTYLTKIWAQAEFFMLLSREKEGQKIILPVLYNITAEELASKSALMADIFAVPATKGLDHVASVLVNEIGKHRELESKNLSGKIKPKIGWWAALLIPVLILMGYAFFQYNNSPNQEVIEKSIENRITTIQASANIDWQQITQIAIGFPNKSGAWELRNNWFKGSSAPKDISIIASEKGKLAILEGFIDFLSLQETDQKELQNLRNQSDFLILNSLRLLNRSIPIFQSYREVILLLDNDQPAQEAKVRLKENGIPFTDASSLYARHKDVNEFLIANHKAKVKQDISPRRSRKIRR